MKHRRAQYAVVTALALLVLSCGLFISQKRTLDKYRQFIESHYKAELKLIENKMRIGKDVGLEMTGLEALDASDAMLDEIGQAISGPEFFHASWSSDGHHGLESLKPMPVEYGYSLWIKSADSGQSRALYFGKAKDGTRLLTFVGRIQSDWKRQYQITFRRSEVDSKMNGR